MAFAKNDASTCSGRLTPHYKSRN